MGEEELKRRILEVLAEKPMILKDMLGRVDASSPTISKYLSVLVAEGKLTSTLIAGRTKIYERKKK
jgi:DNA-binding transcriptional ArsR family regulator